MKKVISALMAALMLTSLAACGGSGGGTAKEISLTEFVESLQNKYTSEDNPFMANTSMTDPDYKEAMFDPFYGALNDIPTKQLVAYQPMMSFVVCEIVLVEVEKSSDVSKVKDIMQARIDEQVAGGAGYPDSIENWQNNSRVVDQGNYVMMIAWSGCDDVVADFEALFK